jgi:hypothetical protein
MNCLGRTSRVAPDSRKLSANRTPLRINCSGLPHWLSVYPLPVGRRKIFKYLSDRGVTVDTLLHWVITVTLAAPVWLAQVSGDQGSLGSCRELPRR